jgi:hypothetical protein
MSNTVSKHAFPKRNCSECSTRRNREAKIVKVKEDIALLDKFNIPHPKADSQLSMLNHFAIICREKKCHRGEDYA